MSISAKTIKDLADKGPLYRRFFDYLSNRKNHTEAIEVTAIERITRGDHREVIALMKDIAEAELGRFIVGRGSKKTRIEWWVSAPEIGQAYLGNRTTVEWLETETEMIDHTLSIRGLALLLRLPSDLTAEEAKDICEYIRRQTK